MSRLSDPFRLGALSLKNRIVLPPMVVFHVHGTDGYPAARTTLHYARRAIGSGLVIQEATAVLPEGRLNARQLGLWEDGQIEALAPIVHAVHAMGSAMLVQLHHAGPKAVPEAGEALGPTGGMFFHTAVKELRLCEIERIRDAFIAAALRAEQAGYDGVELHGAHGYLLNWFLYPQVNLRTDRYGDPLQLVREIVQGIRAEVNARFVVTLRLGVSNPPTATEQAQLAALAEIGVDGLNISSGVIPCDTQVPADFPLSALVYRCAALRPHTKLPLMAVGGLDAPGAAETVLQHDMADLVCIASGQLADAYFAAKLLLGETPQPCLRCKQGCGWRFGLGSCPRNREGQ